MRISSCLCHGMTGNQWFDNTELARSEGGLLKANKFCQSEGADKVYVAGDSGSFPRPWLVAKTSAHGGSSSRSLMGCSA